MVRTRGKRRGEGAAEGVSSTGGVHDAIHAIRGDGGVAPAGALATERGEQRPGLEAGLRKLSGLMSVHTSLMYARHSVLGPTFPASFHP